MNPVPPIESTQWVDEVARWPAELRGWAKERAELYARLDPNAGGRQRGHWAYLALRGLWHEDSVYRQIEEARAKAEMEASAREPERRYGYEGLAEQAAEVLDRFRRGPARGATV